MISHTKICRFKLRPFGHVMNVAEAIIKTSRGAFATLTFNALLEKSEENTACVSAQNWHSYSFLEVGWRDIFYKIEECWSQRMKWLLLATGLGIPYLRKKQPFKSEGRYKRGGGLYEKLVKIHQNKTRFWMSHIKD